MKIGKRTSLELNTSQEKHVVSIEKIRRNSYKKLNSVLALSFSIFSVDSSAKDVFKVS